MKTALLNLIDYIFTTGSGDPDEDENIAVEDILNVIMESLVKLHHHVGVDETDVDDVEYGYTTGTDTPITEDDVELFKQMLGLIPEATNKEKEEDDGDDERTGNPS